MKKLLIRTTAALILSASLSSCTQVADMINRIPPDSPDTVPISDVEHTTPPSIDDYKVQMNLNSYMRYFVNYFHEPYNMSEKIDDDDILTLVLYFCYSHENALDFVEIDEATQTVYIEGEDFRKTAKLLLGDSFDPTEYHDYFYSAADMYIADDDTYVTFYAKGYWGGEPYYIADKTPINITDNGSTVTVTADVYFSPDLGVIENTRTLEYTFEKIVDNEMLFYRIKEIKLAK